MSITVAKFRDVADGIQPGQFMIGDREPVASLADLDPVYKRLLDEPVTAIVAVTGSDGQPNLTPVWFDYEGDTVLLNLATHRKKTGWLRTVPHATFLLMNPENAYHWLSLKTVVKREISEDDPAEGQRVTDQLDRIWVKYTGNEPPYALPAAIAAALCLPRVPVLAFTGDGGLGLTLAEIETAVRLSLLVIVIVFNDAALSLIKIKQKPAGHGGEEAVRYRPTSFAAAAAAMGAAGAAVSSERELAAALTDALARPGPTVIDAHVDPAGYPAVMDLSRGQAGRRSVPGISRVNQVTQVKERVQ